MSILDKVEKFANRLPDPFILFFILAILVLIASAIGDYLGLKAIHPANGNEIRIVNLLTPEFLRKIFTDAVKNFIEFPPLGLVLVTVMGVGLAERTGMLSSYLKLMVTVVPKSLIVPALAFSSIFSHIMGDACVVIMPALGAILFKSVGRNPIAGLVIAFVGACGGISANIILTAIDPLLSGFTTAAAKIIDSTYEVYPTANYYFMLFSSIFLTSLITFINWKIIEPQLGFEPIQQNVDDQENLDKLNKNEQKAVIYSLISLLILTTILLFLVLPEKAVFRDSNGNLIPLYKSIIFLIMTFFGISGVVYGIVAKTVSSSKDVASKVADSIGSMGSYIILAFAASQFLAYFMWSNFGIVIAVNGADFLKSIGLNGVPLLIAFMLFSGIMNLFITSASAKWAIFAPIFVPMMMLLGFSPEATQALFRVADSPINLITPLLPYFPIIIILAKKYDHNINFGKLLRYLLPYAIIIFVTWGSLLIAWIILDIPLGPESLNFFDPINLTK